MPLTDTRIRNAKPQGRPVKLSDGGGLHLLIAPQGSKLWR
ncbi:MAG: Arm DNA-binding domain-containing protein, partial [Proteobacteria bacterium]|nr:Arm DNA-binding domain-containing protein [Pseudomonadota bacterium]